MADLTIKHLDEYEIFESAPGIKMLYAGVGLGLTGWNMNIIKIEPNCSSYKEHDHSNDDQEKLYIVLNGHATLTANGEEINLEQGMMARLGPSVRRKFVTGLDGATIISMSNMLARKPAKE